ncbi:MAG: A24 family peptidase [Angelakisella sp.]
MIILFISWTTLAVAAYVDCRTHTIPHSIPVLLLTLGAVNCYPNLRTLLEVLSDGLIVLAGLLVVSIITEAMGHGSMGGGDIKLLVALATLIGLVPLGIVVVSANILSLVYLLVSKAVRRSIWAMVCKRPLPMAPFYFIAYTIWLIV